MEKMKLQLLKILTYFLDQFNYSHMEISDNEYVKMKMMLMKLIDLKNIAKQISDSTNRTAQNYYKYFFQLMDRII